MSNLYSAEQDETVKKALDERRVLEGENLETVFVEDAIHWASVYEELIDFKGRLLGEMGRNLPQLPQVAATEIKTVDMAITERQMNRYKHRLKFWQTRLSQLDGQRQTASR